MSNYSQEWDWKNGGISRIIGPQVPSRLFFEVSSKNFDVYTSFVYSFQFVKFEWKGNLTDSTAWNTEETGDISGHSI